MKTIYHTHSIKGFTLVELAIVMVIIGLLIGGILKGQELITSAKVNSTVSTLKNVGSAAEIFRDKYNQYPGDTRNPGIFLANCTDPLCNTPGDGNRRLNNPPAGDSTATEAARFFPQLSAADLITGIDITKGHIFGGTYLSIPFAGGMTPGYHPTLATAAADFGQPLIDATGMRGGHYLNIHGCLPTRGCQFLTPTQARMIDFKLDDGSPSRGTVRAKVTSGSCATAGDAGIYLEDVQDGTCGLFMWYSS